jgi:hypothetical protein
MHFYQDKGVVKIGYTNWKRNTIYYINYSMKIDFG